MSDIFIVLIGLFISVIIFYFCCLLLKVIPSKSNTVRWLSFLPLALFMELSFSFIFHLLFDTIFPFYIVILLVECFSFAIVLGVCVYYIIPSHKLGILYSISIIWGLLDVGEIIFIEESNHSILFWLAQLASFIIVCYVVRSIIKDRRL